MFTPENTAKLTASGILETAEILKFGADLVSGVHHALGDDGKVGIVEGAGLAVSLIGDVRAAFAGVKSIPVELSQLDASDVEMLGDVIWPAFSGYPSHQRDLLNASLGAVREFVNLYRVYVDPPKATPVP